MTAAPGACAEEGREGPETVVEALYTYVQQGVYEGPGESDVDHTTGERPGSWAAHSPSPAFLNAHWVENDVVNHTYPAELAEWIVRSVGDACSTSAGGRLPTLLQPVGAAARPAALCRAIAAQMLLQASAHHALDW